MELFNLPDLGEGLPDAEIHEWFIKEGDVVQLDQPLVAMETAKAVVEVPSPQAGTVIKCYGKPGDIIKTGHPLIAFAESKTSQDKGTVVGKLEESTLSIEDHFTIGAPSSKSARPKATPAVRQLAKKLGYDLADIKGNGEHGVITLDDVKQYTPKKSVLPEGFEPLHGVRRSMLTQMIQSHEQVVPVSIFDEADIEHWEPQTDITLRLIRAIIHACHKEPALNAWFSTQHQARKIFDAIHLGLAMDSEEGLFVPVIHNAAQLSNATMRKTINEFKKAVSTRTIPSEQLKGATITLSNFGKFAGRFASPIIVPPMVAILAVGRIFQTVVDIDGSLKSHRHLPLSLSFDHRAVTGGEATRFLGEMIADLHR